MCIFIKGVNPAVSPKSYAYTPFVRDGHADGSTARKTGSILPSIFSLIKGNASPAKLDPPPVHPIITSGFSFIASICFIHSSPITVWCSKTWLRTLPRQYLVSELVAATSTASEIAMPRLPGLDGSDSRILRPDSVTVEGDGWTFAPHVSIISLRYGFWSYEARTCHTWYGIKRCSYILLFSGKDFILAFKMALYKITN